MKRSESNLRYGEPNWTEWYTFFLDRFVGDATFQYAMRVQIPGEFVVAPVRVELMYQPKIHANTDSYRFAFMERR